ncbi:MAG TPA: hypothetical protein VFM93_13855 [Candidatus Limnocylindria bacterium]|nr:hypothetical protein [Candidatus Limnocylindria bacterium]
MREAALPSQRPANAAEAAAARQFPAGRGFVVFLLFLAGLAGGVLTQLVVNPPAAPNPYPQLPVLGEPPETAELMRVVLADDARTLARMLEGELLQALGEALDPMGEILEAKFVGSTERGGDILAAYTVVGRMGGIGSEQMVAGVVFRVRGGRVVGVN